MTKNTLPLVSPEVDEDMSTYSDDEKDLFSDAAFNLSKVVESDASRTKDKKSLKSNLKSARQVILHPRRAVRHKATKTTAGKISSAPKSYLSNMEQRDFLDAHDNLDKAKSAAFALHTSESTDENSDANVEDARRRVEQLEDHRESLRTAWVIERHVNRVRVVQRSMVKPLRTDYDLPVTGSRVKTDWARYLGRLAVYYTYGFTSHHIDDLENPPFDFLDLSLMIERLAIISGPWQTFFLNCRKIYKWESPRQTIKWMVLFWSLWYTNHIVGYFYFWIIFTTIRNHYCPSSINSIRESMARGADRRKKAQAWSELIEHHGRKDWMEPLLDEIGPLIQQQLGDLVDFLEVLSNFYHWERPYKTAETLFVALVLLLITLFCDTTFCVKLVWLNVGGAFFFTFPIATNFPKYRRVVNLFRWFFWDIPDHRELGIMRLQENSLLMDARSLKRQLVEQSISDYDTADEEKPKLPKAQYTFRAYNGKSSGALSIDRSGVSWYPKHPSSTSPSVNSPFTQLQEMRKLAPNSQSKSTKMLRPNTEGLQFIYGGSHTRPATSATEADVRTIELNVKAKKRHEIFSLVLAWSGQKWQPLSIERHENKEDQHQTFDKALKRALH